MTILDTHIWVWWTDGGAQLPANYQAYLQANQASGLGVSAISLWEIAKLVEYGRLLLAIPIDQWLPQALARPHIRLLPLTWEIAVESTRLPGVFHRDPSDQVLVATARLHSCPLMTVDRLIRAYPHVQLAP